MKKIGIIKATKLLLIFAITSSLHLIYTVGFAVNLQQKYPNTLYILATINNESLPLALFLWMVWGIAFIASKSQTEVISKRTKTLMAMALIVTNYLISVIGNAAAYFTGLENNLVLSPYMSNHHSIAVTMDKTAILSGLLWLAWGVSSLIDRDK